MNMHSNANARRDAILQTVREAGPIRSQGALRKALKERGWRVTQPTLSRDLRELGLARTPTGYIAPEDLPGLTATGSSLSPAGFREERLAQRMRSFVVSVRRANTLVIIKTPPGGAHAVARTIDESVIAEIVGTIAGDDTIFVAATTPASARRLERRFAELAGLGQRGASRS